MPSKVFGVITIYDDAPDGLFQLFDEFIIYDQSTKRLGSSGALSRLLAPRISVENLGHNLANNCQWIVENYEFLPEFTAFLKGNVVPRHLSSFDLLESLLRSSVLACLWDDPSWRGLGPRHFMRISSHLPMEINNSWFLQGRRMFVDLDEILAFIYKNPAPRRFIPFAPGANYLVPRNNLRNVPLDVWKFLHLISSYKFFSPEAYAVERLFWTIITSREELHPRFLRGGSWREDLPEEREVGPKSKEGTFFTRGLNSLRRLIDRLEDNRQR